MSDLLKIVYEVAAVRTDYLRLHQRLFHISAGRLLQNLTRRRARGGLTDQQELEEISLRLNQALEGLTQLKKEDLSIRRGSEIETALCEYAQALKESMTALERLMEIRQSPQDGRQGPCQSQATRIAYDDAVQYHNRLGARLNELLTTL